MMFCSYLEEEDITYREIDSRILKVKLGVRDLDENKIRTKVIDLFEERSLLKV